MRYVVSFRTVVNYLFLSSQNKSAIKKDVILTANQKIWVYNSNLENTKGKYKRIKPITGVATLECWYSVFDLALKDWENDIMGVNDIYRYIKNPQYLSECRRLHISKSCYFTQIQYFYYSVNLYVYYFHLCEVDLDTYDLP